MRPSSRGSARYDAQLRVESFQIELTDDAVVPLFDQKLPRTRLQSFLDEAELARAQTKSRRVFLAIGIRIRKQDFGRRLLDDGSTDRAIQHIAGTLCRQTHHGVEFAPCLWTVFGEALERRIPQQPPEFVHPANQTTSVEKLFDQMKQIQRDRRAHDFVFEELGDVKAHDWRP